MESFHKLQFYYIFFTSPLFLCEYIFEKGDSTKTLNISMEEMKYEINKDAGRFQRKMNPLTEQVNTFWNVEYARYSD